MPSDEAKVECQTNLIPFVSNSNWSKIFKLSQNKVPVKGSQFADWNAQLEQWRESG
jgi:hypothetical protein